MLLQKKFRVLKNLPLTWSFALKANAENQKYQNHQQLTFSLLTLQSSTGNRTFVIALITIRKFTQQLILSYCTLSYKIIYNKLY